MLEPAYTSVEAMAVLHEDGIRTGRERVAKMADALFGRDKRGKHRRISGGADVRHSRSLPPDRR